MVRIQHSAYLRSNQIHREMSAIVRYAKETPGKTQLVRDYLAAALAEVDAALPKPAPKKESK